MIVTFTHMRREHGRPGETRRAQQALATGKAASDGSYLGRQSRIEPVDRASVFNLASLRGGVQDGQLI